MRYSRLAVLVLLWSGLLPLAGCQALRQAEPGIEQQVIAHRALIESVVRLETAHLVEQHPGWAPALVTWGRSVQASVQPQGMDLVQLEPALIATIDTYNVWNSPQQRLLARAAIQSMLDTASAELARMEPHPGGLLLTVGEVGGWIASTAQLALPHDLQSQTRLDTARADRSE